MSEKMRPEERLEDGHERHQEQKNSRERETYSDHQKKIDKIRNEDQIKEESENVKWQIDNQIEETDREIDELKVHIMHEKKGGMSVDREKYEEMGEEEIMTMANKGRKESVSNVKAMIQATSWIPKRLKE